jgi:cell wall-associated NlpC family hydrolase
MKALEAGVPGTINGRGRIVQLASTQLGSPYIWADLDPQGGGSSGFDCSGLTKWVASQVGINLPHSADLQSRMLPKVAQNELAPGDLVFFDYGRLGPGVADHVGIYAGDGQMIAASSSADMVHVQAVDWSHFLWGGRL